MEYVIVIEQTPKNFSAYAPDLPGCVATGTTREEAAREIRSTITFHIEDLREQNEEIPMPSCSAAVVKIESSTDYAPSEPVTLDGDLKLLGDSASN